MHRPDYHPSSRRSARWAPLLIFGLILGLLGAGLFNGWWSDLLASDGDTMVRQEPGALPTPIVATNPPRVLDPVRAGATSSSTNTAAVDRATPTATLQTVALGELAPDFTLPDLFDERIAHTLSGYRGRPVILNFWASWCVPCRREMPALEATAARYADDGLFVLGMNQTYIDDLDAARVFVEELGLTFPNSRDDSGAVGADSYRVVGIPTSVFINAEGSVVHIQIGEMSRQEMAAYAERLVAGLPPAGAGS
ncbi:MAG: TlpA disulfide reductase family protein [Anaerolineae bacterium]|nr:TlpA disulfide reductase family protein [Anaerolineae bacterium]